MNFDFKRVVDTISDAVNLAQKRIKEHQLKHFEDNFEKDGSPVSQNLKVKSKGERGQTMGLPLICLMSAVSLDIDSFSIDLTVPIVSESAPKQKSILLPEKAGDDDFVWGSIAKDYCAKINISFSASEPNEAWLRVSSMLLETTFI